MAVTPCSGLRILSHTPLQLSFNPNFLLVRGQGFDGARGTCTRGSDGACIDGSARLLLDHFVVDGEPPALRMASSTNVSVADVPGGNYTTDGFSLAYIAWIGGSRLIELDEANQPRVRADIHDSMNTTAIALFDDLALVRTASYTEYRVTVYASGDEVLRRDAEQSDFRATSYGCGLAWGGGPTMHFLPIDGTPPMSAATLGPSDVGLAPWPYDPRVVAVTVLFPEGTPKAPAPCGVTLSLIRDDGTTVLRRSYPSTCRNVETADPVETNPLVHVLATTVGPVLEQPDGSYQLLDVAGNPLGDSVLVPVSNPAVHNILRSAAIGDKVVVISTEVPESAASMVFQTTLGCQ
jgi:hypothetical protein